LICARFIELVSALEQNTSLLHLDLRHFVGFNERAFLALAESQPEITKRFADPFYWYRGGLLAYVVFANVVCNKQDSNAPDTNIEEFDAVEKHSLDNSKVQKCPGLLLQVQIV
jgi:hypothetical protein